VTAEAVVVVAAVVAAADNTTEGKPRRTFSD
jgi:predicted small secreted protein